MKYHPTWSMAAVFAAVSSILLLQCANPSEQPAASEALTLATTNDSMPAGAIPNALPFKLEFVPLTFSEKPALPRLQSYVAATTQNGNLLIVGGRWQQGLHMFKSPPGINFPRDSSNHTLYLINPGTGDSWSFDARKLPDNLSAPLSSTNMQACYDRATDQMYIVGGYGWKADGSTMITFTTIIRFKVEQLASAIQSGASPSTIAGMIAIDQDERFAVTGGEMFLRDGSFYLVFGQRFDGQYSAFGGGNFTQKYTEEIRIFDLRPGTLKILNYGATSSPDADRPFHRRDGNIVEDVDPATGKQRIAAYGGVFQPGAIKPYVNPIYISGTATPVVDRKGSQKFSQYECPVISVYDSTSSNPTTYNTFFGGIGHYFYYQTPSQDSAYQLVSKEGRNDGFPFVSDISTFSQSKDGAYNEYINIGPIPGTRLLGASIPFIEHPDLVKKGLAYENGTIKLGNLPANNRQLIGYIYGSIEAQNPLPLYPNTGTAASNALFAVYLTKTPTPALPASMGHEAVVAAHNLKLK